MILLMQQGILLILWKAKMILAITNKKDLHYQKVKNHIVEDMVIFDVGKLLEDNTLHYSTKDGFVLNIEGKDINVANIKSIWYRRLFWCNFENLGTSSRYIRNEFVSVINSFWQSNQNIFYLPNPIFENLADNKLYQLSVATKIGLNVPDTIISNTPQKTLNFLKNKDKLIIKSVHRSGVIESDSQIFALKPTLVKSKILMETIDKIQNCPMIIQDFVQKKLDLRITIVKKEIFACEIHSQDSSEEKYKIDYRGNVEVDHKIHDLPNDIKDKLLKMCQILNLNFGCVDMVIDGFGNYVFLEINPNGQWLWIEKLTNMPISKSIAKALVEGNK
jgi:RimK-like ATP-grasp domain